MITAVTLRTDQDLTPDNPASVTFHILGTTYRVNDIVIPAGDSQVVWVKWHTPSTPQTVTITVSVSGAYTAQDTFVAKIVDLNEHIPPDPVATDTNPGYSVPPLPSETRSSLPTGASGAATGCLYGYGATTVKMAGTGLMKDIGNTNIRATPLPSAARCP